MTSYSCPQCGHRVRTAATIKVLDIWHTCPKKLTRGKPAQVTLKRV